MKENKKLDVNSIIQRLSDGEMYQIVGGGKTHYAKCPTIESHPLCLCLAGCGCAKPNTACSVCQASI